MKKRYCLLILIGISLFSCTKENEVTLSAESKLKNGKIVVETESYSSGGFCKNCGAEFPSFDVFPKANGAVDLVWVQGVNIQNFSINMSFIEYYGQFTPQPIRTYSREVNTDYGVEHLDLGLSAYTFSIYWVKCLNCEYGSSTGWKNLLVGGDNFTFEYLMKGTDGDCLKDLPEIDLIRTQSNNYKIQYLFRPDIEHWDDLEIDKMQITESQGGKPDNIRTISIKEGVEFDLPKKLFYSYTLRFYSSQCPRNDLHYIETSYAMNTTDIPPYHQFMLKRVNSHARISPPL